MNFSSFRNWQILVLVFSLIGSQSARAVDLLTTAESFYDEADDTRVGIEVEFMNISADDSVTATLKAIGGKAALKYEEKITTLKGYDKDGKAIYNTEKTPYYEITGSSVDGKVILKIESNQIDDFNMAKSKDLTIELVTDPISGLKNVNEVQKVMDELKAAGAKGTSAKNAVSTQINQEVAKGVRENAKAIDEVNMMRAYTNERHRKQIKARIDVPAIRQPYVESYSEGFLKKLRDPKYNPTWRELYDDFIYRQSLELRGQKNKAWELPIAEVRKRVLAQKLPVVPSVVKQNLLRESSILAYMVPDDKMNAEMIDSGWIKPYPIREFREFNNTFDVVTPYKQVLGLDKMVKKYGNFDHDKLLAELSGVEEKSIQQLRKAALESEKTGKPYDWRYFLADPEEVDKKEYAAHKKAMYDKKDMVGFLAPSEKGVHPVILPGESVVMHRRPIHYNNIRGKYNPGLTNMYIAQALENKYTEAKFLEEYAPGAMPPTKLMSDVAKGEKDVNKVLTKLNKEFPKGWIIKGVWDLGTEGMLITDKMNLTDELAKYKASDFDSFKATLDADEALRNGAPEYYLKQLTEHPGYQGWRITNTINQGSGAIVQERMKIAKEFRVEVIGGKVLGHGSTIDRYAYKNGYKTSTTKGDVAQVETYTQRLVNSLPKELRATPWAFDISINEDGSMGVVETNPGSNSNFLYEEDWKKSVDALSKKLDDFPAEVKKGYVDKGLEPEQQMAWLDEHFKKWGVNVPEQYQGFQFTKTGIIDAEFPEKDVDPKAFLNRWTRKGCWVGYDLIGKQ